ncbi:MAG: type II toxin-antitoxin system VapC family toxin [Edaphobacter sp.]
MINLFTRSEDRTLLVSVLAAIEVRSAIRRRQMLGDLHANDADLAISTLNQETGRIIEHPITAPVISEATGLVDRHGLRALDSIQLASAMVARTTLTGNDSMTFAASDHKLLQAAQKEGFVIWNPASVTP